MNEYRNKKSPDFVMNVHKNKYKHMFDWENPDILDFERHWFKRSISEMLYIKSNKYSVNKKKDIAMLSNVYMPIIKHL